MTRLRAAGALVVAALAVLAVMSLGAGPAAAESTAPGFDWPLPGTPQVGRPFAPPASAWGAGHRGVDLLADVGSPVLAAGSGRVTYAGLLAGRGVVTVSHHSGLRTTYEPVDATVSVGDEVAQGDLLGLLTTGHASCPLDRTCLHWGLLRGSTYLDPLRLVERGRVRLLPAADLARPAAPVEPPGARSARAPAREASTAASSPSPYRVVRTGQGEGTDDRWPGTLAVGAVLAGAGVLAASRLRL